MKKYSIIISSVYILFSSAMSVESETMNVNEKFAFIKEIYTDSWALIIGINEYKHVKSLNYAEDDANLRQDGFLKGELTVFDDDYTVELFANGLNFPTTMDFVGNDLLVLEKNTGKVIRINENGEIDKEPVLVVPVYNGNESGLLGIATEANHVFLYFTESFEANDPQKPNKNTVYHFMLIVVSTS